jgi:hypothetical protein
LKKVQKTAKQTLENRKNPFKEKKSENKTVKQSTKSYRKKILNTYWAAAHITPLEGGANKGPPAGGA